MLVSLWNSLIECDSSCYFIRLLLFFVSWSWCFALRSQVLENNFDVWQYDYHWLDILIADPRDDLSGMDVARKVWTWSIFSVPNIIVLFFYLF